MPPCRQGSLLDIDDHHAALGLLARRSDRRALDVAVALDWKFIVFAARSRAPRARARTRTTSLRSWRATGARCRCPRERRPRARLRRRHRAQRHDVTAELLGRHSRFCDVPIECRFHCNPNGLADVVSGRATPEQFVRKLRTYWWHRVRIGCRVMVPAGVAGRRAVGRSSGGAAPRPRARGVAVRGLHQIVDRDRFEAAVANVRARPHGDDLLEASRRLFYDLLEPLRERAGKPALVEMSCFTIAAAPELARIFPEARFVHAVRDGRDSGSSKVDPPREGPPPDRRRLGNRLLGGPAAPAEEPACAGSPTPTRAPSPHQPRRARLVATASGAYGGLLEFLGVDDEPAMREFFDRRDDRRRRPPRALARGPRTQTSSRR